MSPEVKANGDRALGLCQRLAEFFPDSLGGGDGDPITNHLSGVPVREA